MENSSSKWPGFSGARQNHELAGRELFADDPTYDGRWLGQIFGAAGVEPAFVVSKTPARIFLEHLAKEQNFDPLQFQQARDEARQDHRHRAEADALVNAKLWWKIMESANQAGSNSSCDTNGC